MPNREEGEITIRLDRVRVLKYSFSALSQLEDALGVPLEDMDRKVSGLKKIRALLWAGLRENDPMLELRDVDRLIEQSEGRYLDEKLKYIQGRLDMAMSQCMSPEAKKKMGPRVTPGAGVKSSA